MVTGITRITRRRYTRGLSKGFNGFDLLWLLELRFPYVEACKYTELLQRLPNFLDIVGRNE
jgi:hypothetical protein